MLQDLIYLFMNYILCAFSCWIFGIFFFLILRVLHIPGILPHYLWDVANIFFQFVNCFWPCLSWCSPTGKVLLFHFYIAKLITFSYFLWILSQKICQQPGQSGIRMVSIFTFGTLICLFILTYAVRHGSNLIFFQMINQLSHTIKKKKILGFLSYSTGLTLVLI